MVDKVKLTASKVQNQNRMEHGVNLKDGLFDPFGFSVSEKFGKEQVRKLMAKNVDKNFKKAPGLAMTNLENSVNI